MDARLQRIVENLDYMKIGLDETFQFSCNQCGKCCINRDDILLNARDVYRISKELKVEPEDMIREYGEVYIGGSSRIPIVRVLPRGTTKRCGFLKENKCSIHRAKPVICAMYPIGRCVVHSKGDNGNPGDESTEMLYILNDTDCGGKAKIHTVREWLNEFGIPEEDSFFMKWQKVVLEVGNMVRCIEGNVRDETLKAIWSAAYVLLYLRYDTEKEFLPQFEKNADELLSVFAAILNGLGIGTAGAEITGGRNE